MPPRDAAAQPAESPPAPRKPRWLVRRPYGRSRRPPDPYPGDHWRRIL